MSSEPLEIDNDETPTKRLTLFSLLYLAVPCSMLLGICALPDRTFATEVKVNEELSLYNYYHREVIHVALVVFIYFTRWWFLKTCSTRLEHAVLFVGMILFSLSMIYWRIVDWSALELAREPHPPDPMMLWVGIPVAVLTVPTVSFLIFDARHKPVSRGKFVLRWVIEILLITPLWKFSWSFFCLMAGWISL